MPKKVTTEDFIEKSRSTWGNRWDYSNTIYKNMTTKVVVTCREHGDFTQKPSSHYGAVGCPKCKTNYTTQEDFIAKSKSLYGDRWDLSRVEYKGRSCPVEIVCKLHGSFFQSPAGHYRGVGCSQCVGRATDKEGFIQRASKKWGDRWDYSEVIYLGINIPVTIKCSLHGSFQQTPAGHYKSVGCSLCHHYKIGKKRFIERSQKVWGDRWDYSESDYSGAGMPLTIVCTEHGIFKQDPSNHYSGRLACVECRHFRTSKGENEVARFVKDLGISVDQGRRDLLKPDILELDLFMPDTNIAIEYNGVYYHSEKFRSASYHSDKYQKCAAAGIKLIQVWEDDWILKRAIVEEHIRQVLGKSKLPKIPARKTQTTEVSVSAAREFLESYHIQGFASSTHYLGLMYKDSLVALACFKKQGPDFTLTRYATSANVQGGHSKLVALFERTQDYRRLVTFADLSFGSGNLYEKTGWTQDRVLSPDYRYVNKQRREHKFGYRLKRFMDDPNLIFEPGKTERELARINGLLRIYDAGKIRFVKPHPADTRERLI